MRILAAAAIAALVAGTASAQVDRLHTKTDGNYESGWVVQIPAGSSDYFNVRFDGNGETVTAMSIAVADFGASVSYPRVGHFNANLGLDPSGLTPDLTSPKAEAASPAVLGSPIGTTFCVPTGPHTATGICHKVVCFPPGDPGLLGVSADTDTTGRGCNESPGSPNPADSSGFTLDGYSTPAAAFGSGDFGLGCYIDCCQGPLPYLQVTCFGPVGEVSADGDSVTLLAGDVFGISFWGRDWNGICDLWLLFISFLGAPILPVGSPLPSFPTGTGCCLLRVVSSWPLGAGNLTINFVAAAGCPGVIGSVGLTNEITIHALPDPQGCIYGNKDNGTYENGWVVQIPSLSSDYFSQPLCGQGAIATSQWAVMDFGASVSSYPSAGFAPANLVVDPGGNTPDLSNPYTSGSLPFPALTFVTTSGQLVNRAEGISPAADPIQFGQFPPLDPGLLGFGADTDNAFIDGLSGWSLDGYSTPANLFGLGVWGWRAI